MKKIVVTILLIVLILSPRIYWELKSEKAIDIVVIDKTVPKKDYREHKGLFHVLDSKKIVRPDSELYDIGRDYYGFDPYDQVAGEPFLERPADMIYVADTYGVFSDDLKDDPDGEHSELIYGGMELLEWNEIMASKKEDTVLIAEFNSFASPTSERVSEIMQKNLGVSWSGWIGRHFNDLSGDEIPDWLKENHKKQTGGDWIFAGPGTAFVHTSGRTVVLDGQESGEPAHFRLTEQGKKAFPKVRPSEYLYWFDIVEPLNDTEVLAAYELDLTEKGRSVLEAEGIPEEFPAVLKQPDLHTYYFAGDYADFDKQPIVKWQGVHRLYKYFSKDVSSFYWMTYFPMMEAILDKTYERKNGEPIER